MLTDECTEKLIRNGIEVKSVVHCVCVCARVTFRYANRYHWHCHHRRHRRRIGNRPRARRRHTSEQYGKRLFNAHISFYFTFELKLPPPKKHTHPSHTRRTQWW